MHVPGSLHEIPQENSKFSGRDNCIICKLHARYDVVEMMQMFPEVYMPIQEGLQNEVENNYRILLRVVNL